MPSYNFISDIKVLEEVEVLVDTFVCEHGISFSLKNRLLIASIEAISNSIRHGNGIDSGKIVKFHLERKLDIIWIVVEDEGGGFNYRSLPDPTLPENILKLNGRGVFLMQKLSDKMVYNKKGNRVELYFNI